MEEEIEKLDFIKIKILIKEKDYNPILYKRHW